MALCDLDATILDRGEEGEVLIARRDHHIWMEFTETLGEQLLMTTLVPIKSTILLQSRRGIHMVIVHPQINLLNRWVEGEKWLSPHSICGNDSDLMPLLDQIVALAVTTRSIPPATWRLLIQ